MSVQCRDDSARMMTVPDEITGEKFVTVTGNDFVSLPEIDRCGRVFGVTFLHAGCAGLIEVRGSRDGSDSSAAGLSTGRSPDCKHHRTHSDGVGTSSCSGRDGPGDRCGAAPFIAPVFTWDGTAVNLAAALPEFALEGDWIPTFSWTGGNTPGSGGAEWRLSARIVPPPDEKGFCYILELRRLGVERHEVGEAPEDARGERNSEAPGSIEAEVGLHLAWGYSGIRVFTSRELPLVCTCRYDRWTHSVVAEALGPLPVFGLALNASADFDHLEIEGPADDAARDGQRRPGTPVGATAGEGSSGSAGTRHIVVRASKSIKLAPGDCATVAFYVTFNREADGARTTSVHLRRLGWQALEARTLRWLAERRVRVPGRPHEESVLNRNLLFCRFFATGKTLDSEEVVVVTSRSPRYYVSAAFWARDALLWSLPGLMLVDRGRAREVLLRAFSVGTRHVGDHAEYIDGRALYPGFELDEAAAFLVGLGTYLGGTSDFDIIGEPQVLEGIKRVLAEVEKWTMRTADGKPVLCRTFLDPSDDPVRLPFLTYNNVLVRKGWLVAADVLERLSVDWGNRWASDDLRRQARELREAAEALSEAIRRYCVVDGPFGPMYAWAVDIAPHEACGDDGRDDEGGGAAEPARANGSYRGLCRTEAELYDDPPGSLELLGHYDRCRRDGEEASILANTRRWIHSHHNPYFVEGRFAGPGSAHSPNPWPIAAASAILAEAAACDASGRCDLALVKRAIRLLTSAPMDSGLACESIDPETGAARTGAAFASGAGFLAYSLWRGLCLLDEANPPGGWRDRCSG
ncbi:MAG: glycoside hydrolase family 125 protein [Bacillota bacterium]